MSILNIVLTENAALIGTDTASGPIDGSAPGHISKCLALPHINAVIAGRGNTFFLCAMLVAVNLSNSTSLDELETIMPKLLRDCFDLYIKQSDLMGGPDEPKLTDEQSIALVGWSPAKKRMLGWIYMQETREQGFSMQELDEGTVAPWDQSFDAFRRALQETKAISAMESLAQAQVAFTRKVDPNLPMGGRLVLTRISDTGIGIFKGRALD